MLKIIQAATHQANCTAGIAKEKVLKHLLLQRLAHKETKNILLSQPVET